MPTQVLDYSLNNFKVPGLAQYAPPFGSKKVDGQGLSTTEITVNEMMPFLKQRSISGASATDQQVGIINADSIAKPIQFDATFAVAAGINLQLDDPSYEGQIARAVASFKTGSSARITLGAANSPTSVNLNAEETLLLLAVNGKWKRVDADLLAKLDNKSDKGHGHAIVDVADLQVELNNKAAVNHTHKAVDITDLQAALDSAVNSVILSKFPVGTVYMSVENNNPANFLGGNWVVWGNGRVPVGVDTSDGNFNTVEKTGGAHSVALSIEELAPHRHYFTCFAVNDIADAPFLGTRYSYSNDNRPKIGVTDAGINFSMGGAYDYLVAIKETGEGWGHNNLQPYITCYMWKRVA